ncbi:adenylate kinase-domain-containing protein [Stachybotrys elegans]|uniref:GTP:AMP phosphotransferase, mitochondrial n=1 Tax=Stachybotrys elegans TaxID=80388 RepID=A0A8K0SNW3_9HYPO|nr:adenylate kinase-domain-containing protein [Stachybotrys elegans]
MSSRQLNRAARVILIGAPGVGKGTQSERLLRRFPQLSSISTGDLLRSNVKKRTPLGIKVESTIKSGGLVADDLVLRLISNELFTRGWLYGHPGAHAYPPSASFLLDGFPRTAAQAKALDRIIPINLVVSIKTPFSVILERIAGRWVHEPSGRVYNTSFNAPKVPGRDDITGEALIQRPDDSEEVYRARFRKFEETSEPLLEHYGAKGVLIEIEGQSSDEISPQLYTEFEKRFTG